MNSRTWARAEAAVIAEASEPVLEHGCYVLGREVAMLEDRLAGYLGTRHAVGCNSGFGAHLLSLLALDIGVGSNVLVSPFSPPSFAGAVVRRNARLHFADVDEDDFHVSASAIGDHVDGMQLLVVHHLFGGAADMPVIRAAAGDVPIIEVLTYSFGTEVEPGRRAGTYGTVTTACLREETTLGAYGDAGMIWTDDPAVAERLRLIRKEDEYHEVYQGITAGNFHMDTLHAAILLRKLDRWAETARLRRERARLIQRAVSTVDGLKVPGATQDAATRFVILAEDREGLSRYLREYGIQAEPWWPVPLHLQPGFAGLGFAKGDFPNAESVAARSLYLRLPDEKSVLDRVPELLSNFSA
ncbi:DegT/DnrJ/EryC1/StrS family aminotransferase [Amycolatopsis samaneae]|uniref:DegT/DnrJ/EryC1/StrS family aminotransferase n=1 Tax=Amycolatopsis samaneae TaxID=664691 RepID=A0ABW5GHN7_9PSEU